MSTISTVTIIVFNDLSCTFSCFKVKLFHSKHENNKLCTYPRAHHDISLKFDLNTPINTLHEHTVSATHRHKHICDVTETEDQI